MSRIINARPLTREAFAPFGDVIDFEAPHRYLINTGMTERFHDQARVEVLGSEARVLISLFRGQPYSLPLQLTMVERHPLGSQAFMPLTLAPYLVIVCPDNGEEPDIPQAFIAHGQGVNYPVNRWHAVLTPLDEPQDFLVVDRGGEGKNGAVHHFAEPWEIRASA